MWFTCKLTHSYIRIYIIHKTRPIWCFLFHKYTSLIHLTRWESLISREDFDHNLSNVWRITRWYWMKYCTWQVLIRIHPYTNCMSINEPCWYLADVLYTSLSIRHDPGLTACYEFSVTWSHMTHSNQGELMLWLTLFVLNGFLPGEYICIFY